MNHHITHKDLVELYYAEVNEDTPIETYEVPEHLWHAPALLIATLSIMPQPQLNLALSAMREAFSIDTETEQELSQAQYFQIMEQQFQRMYQHFVIPADLIHQVLIITFAQNNIDNLNESAL